jgi:alpha-methylacyl-CoA racemase
MPMLPLDDLTVLDFSTLLPGPLASLFLAEAGARVIRIERPGGEEMRRFPPRFGETSAPYAVLNRGKASIEVDLKADDALARLASLIEKADILIEQFRPGVMERLGFGFEALSAINPRLSIARSAVMARPARAPAMPATTSITRRSAGCSGNR